MERKEYNCIVVGAGLAGLYAAHELSKTLADVLVVEAHTDIGGRVRQIHGLAPWPIEAGPEFVHGAENHKFNQVVKDFGMKFTEKGWPDWWYFGREGRLVKDADVDEEVNQLHELIDSVGDEAPPPPGTDVSAEQWLRSKGTTERQMQVADVCYANDFGCSLAQLGLREMIVENNNWDSGETYLIADQSMRVVVERLAEGLDILTGFPVTAVHYSASGAVLRGPGGRELRARKVIITAPLRVLQAGKIAFSPPLPAAKCDAIRRLRMGNAVKVVCAFSRRFWPAELYDVCCTDCFAPEIWSTQHAPAEGGAAHLHAMVGFIAGDRADAVGRMGAAEAVRRFVAQLDAMFGSTSDPAPASGALVAHEVFDWSEVEWVGGAYSFPSFGAEDGDRRALAAPVEGVLFFAGEAAHAAVNPCMQAALETGGRAAAEAAAALAGAAPARSRL
ncbi:MAG: amine oxidase-like protein [Monoraphidium minutum]|nr:MAG: amine oxidase-like protein [Monoraphidium minutum]